jgi:hypothetical protein
MTVGVLPPTRIISWQQLVQDADPDWNRLKQRPWIYEFSTGRRFLTRPDVYTAPADGVAPVPPGPAPVVQNIALQNDGGVAFMDVPWEFPVSSSGLLPGQIYWDGGVLAIVAGYVFDPTQPPLYLTDPSWLVLLSGAYSMPTINPGRLDGRLWNNGSLVCIDV